MKDSWLQTRKIIYYYYLLTPMDKKTKRKKEEEILAFPWETQAEDKPKKIRTRKEMAALFKKNEDKKD